MAEIKCPICTLSILPPDASDGGGHTYRCPNCGRYRITHTFEAVLGHLGDEPRQRAVLSHAVRRMQRDGGTPTISDHVARAVWEADQLPTATEQLDNVVLYLGSTLAEPGATVQLDPQSCRAILGSITEAAAGWVLRQCHDQNLVEGILTSGLSNPTSILNATLTSSGWLRFQELQREATGSRRAFMAMKYGDTELDGVFSICFKPAVQQAGFNLMRLDEAPRAGLIDDHLRLDIRRSRFLIADLSHANLGAYWEAGYAEGLGRPVIYTCRKDVFEDPARKPHFDPGAAAGRHRSRQATGGL
jgi:hypothetical protein